MRFDVMNCYKYSDSLSAAKPETFNRATGVVLCALGSVIIAVKYF